MLLTDTERRVRDCGTKNKRTAPWLIDIIIVSPPRHRATTPNAKTAVPMAGRNRRETEVNVRKLWQECTWQHYICEHQRANTPAAIAAASVQMLHMCTRLSQFPSQISNNVVFLLYDRSKIALKALQQK
jgi:hypothetical protein